MYPSHSISVLIAAAASLSATPALAEKATPNRTLYSLNQPVVQRTDFVLELPTEGDRLMAFERARLGSWLRSLGVGYGDRVFVEHDGDAAPREDVARVAAEYGLLLSDGAPVLPGAVQPGHLRVIVSRSTASVPGCPSTEKSTGAGATSPDYGCAVNSNLAAMVADPSDLVLGQEGSGTGDAATATKAIKVYREAKPTGTEGLKATVTRGGK